MIGEGKGSKRKGKREENERSATDKKKDAKRLGETMKREAVSET